MTQLLKPNAKSTFVLTVAVESDTPLARKGKGMICAKQNQLGKRDHGTSNAWILTSGGYNQGIGPHDMPNAAL
jgi:hypothetical protein